MVQVTLTPRQEQVLQYAACGYTIWYTGKILGISPRTVEHHLLAARRRLGATNTTHAVALYLYQILRKEEQILWLK